MDELNGPTVQSIKIDGQGDLYHEGVKITHARTIELFLRSLRRLPDGGYVIEVGNESAPVDVEDVPLLITSFGLEHGRPLCITNDGLRDELRPDSLWIGPQGALYGVLADRGLAARFVRSAHVQAAQHVQPDRNAPQRFVICIGEREYPIRLGPAEDGG
ncbi:MAG: DUF1285 domain-containing protein [Candidatus Alcyoniella australis]|nr:DUF1285 domain-containing protein [Candidatus Alcyoniella australis]